LNHAWSAYRNDPDQDAKKVDQILAIKDYFVNGNISLPMGLVRTTEKFAPSAGGAKVEAELLQLYVPKRHNWMVKFLVDRALLVDKQFPDFVPFALKKENPKLFGRWMAKQANFLDQHRNVQLRHVSALNYLDDEMLDQPSLEVLLETNADIHRVYTDFANDRIHLSTTAFKYAAVCKWLDQELTKYSFDVQRFSRVPSIASPTPSLPTGRKSSKYSAAFSLPDDDASLGVSTIVSTRTNPWKRRPPMELVCDLSTAAFPPLAQASKPETGDTATTQVSTIGESDIQQRIDEAIQRAETQMETKLKALQQQIDEQLKVYQAQLDSAINEIVAKTMESLTGQGSPFATKADYAKMDSKFTELTATTTAIWDFLQSQTTKEPHLPSRSPPRQAKRVNMNATPLRGAVTPHLRPSSPQPMEEEGGQI
jgi:hypothetical protein